MKNRDIYQSDESREIFLRLENYSDIFSDFDVRPYSKRALSSDFLDEVKRASNDKYDTGIELVLYVPEEKRDQAQESVIAERLKAHFKKHFLLLRKEKRKILLLGTLMTVLGVISMILATRILFEDPTQSVWLSFLVVFLEPAAWFLLWEGIDQILFSSKNVEPELSFYRKMANERGQIIFKSGELIPASPAV